MRLIDADALDEKLESLKNRYAAQGRTQVAEDYDFVQFVLSAAPTIDAVPVVRCGECVNHSDAPFGGWCIEWSEPTPADGFCYRVERREVDDDG